MNQINNYRNRTNSKLRYAEIHLTELRSYLRKGSGDDFERCHQESFLYHLFGVRDSLLQELNLHYSCGLAINQVTIKKLEKSLKSKGLISAELNYIIDLEKPGEWLNDVKEMRDHSTHRGNVPRVFYEGGPNHGEIHLKNPKTNQLIETDTIHIFDVWLSKTQELIEKTRNP